MISRAIIARATLAASFIVAVAGCDRDLDLLEPAPFPNDAEVFGDALGPGLGWFQPFQGSKLDAFQFDPSVGYQGDGSIRVDVPAPGDPSGGYAGGALVANVPRDLSGYNALTFWARGSTGFTLDVVGLGNDNTGTSLYTAQVDQAVGITTGWQKFVIPIPDASFLTREGGMIFLAEGSENGEAYSMWLDDIQFESLSTLANPRAAIPSQTVRGELGGSFAISGTTFTVDVDGTDVVVAASANYFTFQSSDPNVVQVSETGIDYVGSGTATLTASVAGRAAAGEIVVTVVGPPEVAAPTPDQPAEEVISLFSDAYDDVVVDTWSADWDNADVEDVAIAGDNTKKYTNLIFAGIEFTSQPVDATEKGFIHLDVYAAEPSLQLKFVDFGPDGVFGNDDSEAVIRFDATQITPDAWSSLDIPFSDLGGLAERAHLAQVVVEGTSSTLYIDNFYIYGEPAPTGPQEPETAPAAPTQPAESVISMFSNAYTDVVVDTWSAPWDAATVEDVSIAGTDMKKYTGLTFAGIEAVSAPIDATGMTNFRMDIWTPTPIGEDGFFQIRLVDFGADKGFDGGDDTAANVRVTPASTPPLVAGQWVSIDIPLTDFAGMNRGAIAQMVIEGTPGILFVDNVYFYDASFAPPPPATEPTAPAPAPTIDASKVVSMFSNPYTNVTVDTWSAVWDAADVADVQVAGDDAKKYTNLVFAGIEATSAPIDASALNRFRMDIWTPDDMSAGEFKVKLVDFGANGVFQQGDDTEFQLTFTPSTDPALVGGQWVTIDVPLSDFTGMNTGAIAQMVIEGTPNTLWVDNVIFYDDTPSAPLTEPAGAAPTPGLAAENVISLFSDAYTDVTVDTWSAVWDAADVEDVSIDGNAAKKYSNLTFAGIEFGGAPVDASSMTHFHLHFWTADDLSDPKVFKIKLVDFGADGVFGGGDETEFEVVLTATSTPAVGAGQWYTLDIPLSDFQGMNFGAVAQLIISGDPNTVWIDNVLFHN